MGKDLERYEPLDRRTMRQLQAVTNQARLERAVITAEEANAAYEVDTRIKNAYQLLERSGGWAAAVNRYFTELAQGNPGLEMQLRRGEAIVGLGAEALIHRCMTR